MTSQTYVRTLFTGLRATLPGLTVSRHLHRNNNKMFYCVVKVAVLVAIRAVVVTAVRFVPIETGTTQGSAVVFFTAHQGSLREIEFNPIIFNQVLVNQGSGYNNQTGLFTAPQSGIYQFMFSAQLCRGNFNNHWDITVNNVPKSACHAQVSGGDTTLNTCYLIQSLLRGDRVWIKQRTLSCAWANANSKTITFSGVLLTSRERMSSSCPLLRVDADGSSVHNSVGKVHVSVVGLIACLLLQMRR